MHEHRTIPQRLGDHDKQIDELLDRVADLLDRVAFLEAQAKPAAKTAAKKEEP